MQNRVVVPSDTMRRKGESGEHKTVYASAKRAHKPEPDGGGVGDGIGDDEREKECGRLWMYRGGRVIIINLYTDSCSSDDTPRVSCDRARVRAARREERGAIGGCSLALSNRDSHD